MTSPQPRRNTVPDIQCLSCGTGIYLDDVTYANYQGPVTCPECKQHTNVVIQRKALITANLLAGVYEPVLDILAWNIPADLLQDLGEASVDMTIGSYKSCVVMCRRCVHAILLAHDIEDDPSLQKMIDEAVVKGVFKEELRQTAHAVRFFGVTGAHPKDPLLRNVTKFQASLAIDGTKEIMKGIYPLVPTQPELMTTSLIQMAELQGIRPLENVEDLVGGWPEDADFETFLKGATTQEG